MMTKKQKLSEITKMKCRVKEIALDLEKVQFKSTQAVLHAEINRLESLIANYQTDADQPSSRMRNGLGYNP